ncbi:hypothetical protein [Vibrio metschnikovii]|uniref:hypothetical protein n=1 Tax=Vibrio metschnikovii TaxID=28172 RepID=UPI002FC9D7EC
MAPRLIGIQNGIIVFVFWSCVGLLLVSDWRLAIPFFAVYLFPISLVVAWRSTKLSYNLSRQCGTLKAYVLEGFLVGFTVCIVFLGLSISSQAFAAGTVLDGADLTDIIKYVLFFVLPISVSVGLLGSAQGVLFFHLNRWQLAS